MASPPGHYRKPSLTNEAYEALWLSTLNATTTAGRRVTVSERILTLIECEDAARRALNLHTCQAGYCSECAGVWPCATVRALTDDDDGVTTT